jgi:hypothetical protein
VPPDVAAAAFQVVNKLSAMIQTEGPHGPAAKHAAAILQAVMDARGTGAKILGPLVPQHGDTDGLTPPPSAFERPVNSEQ